MVFDSALEDDQLATAQVALRSELGGTVGAVPHAPIPRYAPLT